MNDVKAGYHLSPRTLTLAAAFALCIAAGIFFVCTTGPLELEKTRYPITLTLDDKTNTTATFSGKPITAYCAFRDSVSYGDVAWHLGSGKILRPPLTSSRTKALQVQLHWDIMPVRKDSLGRYYDSVYISLGGENFRSNSACIFVTNVPPVIDSIKVSRRSYGTQDTIRDTVRTYDSLPTMSIRIFARDVNQNALASIWSGSGSSRISIIAGGVNANYQLLRAGFTDTLALSLYDRQGGNCDKVIFIASTLYNKNMPPLFDSLRVNDSLIKGTWTTFRWAASVSDTLRFRMYSHDPDLLDTAHCTVKAGGSMRLTAVSDTGALYSCKDTLYRDTVSFALTDGRSDSTIRKVVVDVNNRYPFIDSMQCGDSLFQSKAVLFFYAANGRDTLSIRFYAHDPDSGDRVKAGSARFIHNGAGSLMVGPAALVATTV